MADGSSTGGVAAAKLKSFVERIERLEAEKSALAGDIREVFAEAKGNGFDTKIMRQVIKLRKMESGRPPRAGRSCSTSTARRSSYRRLP